MDAVALPEMGVGNVVDVGGRKVDCGGSGGGIVDPSIRHGVVAAEVGVDTGSVPRCGDVVRTG